MKTFYAMIRASGALAFKWSVIIIIGILLLSLFGEGWDKTLEGVEEYSGMFIVIPGGLFVLILVADMKARAFKRGAKSADKSIEKMVVRRHKKKGKGEAEYQRLKQSAPYSPEEARRLRSTVSRGQNAVAQHMAGESGKERLVVPTYVYKQGLPGEHLLLERIADQHTIMLVEDGHLIFYECEKEMYDEGAELGPELARLPIGAVQSIEIEDRKEGRVGRRIAGAALDRGLSSFTRSVVGVRGERTLVEGARLFISYVNEDGIVFDARFSVPTNSRAGKRAMRAIRKTARTLNQFERLEIDLEEFAAILDEDMDPTEFLDAVDDLDIDDWLDDTILAARAINILGAEDKAYKSVKISAGLLSSYLQKPVIIRLAEGQVPPGH